MARTLEDRYRHLALTVEAPGPWPALIEPWAPTSPGMISRLIDAPPVLDRQLKAAGDEHLELMIRSGRHLFDGPVLALDSAQPGLLTARPGTYFDHVRAAEALSREWQAGGSTPLRDRIDNRASGDPLRRGSGRCAALAVSALLVWEGPDGPEFVLGERSSKLAVGAGSWHVVPAGMIEPGNHPISSALARELSEEVCTDFGQSDRAVSGASVLGLTFGLERLQTEVACLLIVTGDRPVLDQDEHVQARWWPFTENGLAAALHELGPDGLLAPAAGTLELARWRLSTRSCGRRRDSASTS